MGNFVLAEEEAEEEADLEGFGGGGEGTTGVLCFCCLSSTKRLHCSICTCALIAEAASHPTNMAVAHRRR